MSESITVAVVTTVGTLLVAFVGYLASRRGRDHESEQDRLARLNREQEATIEDQHAVIRSLLAEIRDQAVENADLKRKLQAAQQNP